MAIMTLLQLLQKLQALEQHPYLCFSVAFKPALMNKVHNAEPQSPDQKLQTYPVKQEGVGTVLYSVLSAHHHC
eukprot:711687-Amphidinium_carterae.1